MKKDRDGIFQRDDCDGFWVSFTDSLGRRRKMKAAGCHTRTQAKTFLSQLKGKVVQERAFGIKEVSDITTEDLFKRYELHQSGIKSLERTKQILKRWQDVFPAAAKDITREQIDKQVAKRRGEKASPATISKEITILKHCLRLAVDDWGYLHKNAAAGVKLPKVENDRPHYLSPGELKAALYAAPDWMRAPLALAAFTGCRRGELFGLQWCEVNLPKRQFYLPVTKNGEFRAVPINNLASQLLDSLLPDDKDDREALLGSRTFVLSPEVIGDGREDLKLRLSVETKRLFKRLKITGSFHTLRHTTASWAIMAGESLYSVGQLLGHKTPRMTARYAHLSPEHLQGTAGKLDAAFAGVLPEDRPAIVPVLKGASGKSGVTA
jgi:integrase